MGRSRTRLLLQGAHGAHADQHGGLRVQDGRWCARLSVALPHLSRHVLHRAGLVRLPRGHEPRRQRHVLLRGRRLVPHAVQRLPGRVPVARRLRERYQRAAPEPRRARPSQREDRRSSRTSSRGRGRPPTSSSPTARSPATRRSSTTSPAVTTPSDGREPRERTRPTASCQRRAARSGQRARVMGGRLAALLPVGPVPHGRHRAFGPDDGEEGASLLLEAVG